MRLARYAARVERSRLSPFGVVLLALVTLGWGFAWPVIKIVLTEVPPLTFRGACLLAGGVGMLGLARLARQPLEVPRRYWGRLVVLSACSIAGWNLFVVYGIALLSSGRAALLAYSMPLWSTLLSIWVLGDRLTARRGVALLLGMGGVGVLFVADLGGMSNAANGVGLMMAAAVSWALGTVLLKRFALPIPTVTLTAWSMVIGGTPILVAAVIREHERWRAVSPSVGAGLAYSVLVGFMFCYWAWNRVALMVPVAVSSVSLLATPVVGVLSGMWFLDEPITWHEVVAGVLILGAIALVVRTRAAGPVAR